MQIPRNTLKKEGEFTLWKVKEKCGWVYFFIFYCNICGIISTKIAFNTLPL